MGLSVLIVILSLSSLVSLVEVVKTEFVGYKLTRIDPIMIWTKHVLVLLLGSGTSGMLEVMLLDATIGLVSKSSDKISSMDCFFFLSLPQGTSNPLSWLWRAFLHDVLFNWVLTTLEVDCGLAL